MPFQARSGRLAEVFDGGRSPLLNTLARLSVLYEDLRLELESILGNGNAAQTAGKKDGRYNYESLYFIRRSLVTIQEFHGCLIEILKTQEYRSAEPKISGPVRQMVTRADQYFQSKNKRIKELRNQLGGHFKPDAVEFAVRNFDPGTIGEVVLQPSDTLPALKLLYADQLVKGAIVSRLPDNAKLEEELKMALDIIGGAQHHAIAATYALVYAFLWDRFETRR
jgi:hypothetical protein